MPRVYQTVRAFKKDGTPRVMYNGKPLMPIGNARVFRTIRNQTTGKFDSFLFKDAVYPFREYAAGVVPVTVMINFLKDIIRRIDVKKMSLDVDFLKQMRSEFVESFSEKAFHNDTGVTHKWKRLSKDTKRQRRKAEYCHNRNVADILVDWGVLRNSIKIKGNTIETSASSFKNTHKHKGFVYAAVHNYGVNNAGKNHNIRIPKRQFMGHTASEKTYFFQLAERYLFDELFIPIG